MRILYLTGGAGKMYCGSCLRDNALATELLRRGHDVTLLPIYTPTLTDEPNVSEPRVFFGGISVYLEQYVPLFRRTPPWLDRLWDSEPMLRLASKGSISTSPKTLGEMTVSMLKAEAGFQHKEITKLIDWLRREQQFDLISLPYTLLLGLAKPLRETLHRPIVCTLQGEDLFLEGLHEPYKSEALGLIRSNVAQVDLFLAVSEYYAEFMQRYLGIPEAKICVVPLGINLAGYDQRKRRDASAPFTVGFFARVAPEKGLHVLSKAYQHLRNETSLSKARLEVAGYLAPEHQTYLAAIKNEMKAAGLASEFNYRGVLNREGKIAFLQNLDVLSVPATYDEPKGIFLLEAMACGVPVVQPRRGGFTEIVEKTRGGLLVEPDDPQKLAAGIRSLVNDPALAQRLGENALVNVRELYSVRQMADQALAAYEYVLNEQTNEAAEAAPNPGC